MRKFFGLILCRLGLHKYQSSFCQHVSTCVRCSHWLGPYDHESPSTDFKEAFGAIVGVVSGFVVIGLLVL